MDIAIIIVASRPRHHRVIVLVCGVFGSCRIIRSSSTSVRESGRKGIVLDSRAVRVLGILVALGLFVAFGRAELAVVIVALSGSLQFMTLLPGVAFVFVVAFLATAVALDAGLVGCPFRLRLGSFVLSFLWTFVGTWLALRVTRKCV